MAQLQLEGAVDNRDTIIAGLREQLRQARTDNAALREENASVVSGGNNLRKALGPLYRALQQIFGELEEAGMSTEPSTSSSPNPQTSAVWDSWKHRLGGSTAKAIDVLMLHGELNHTQLRIHLGCASGTITNVVGALNKYGLINKNGNKISLKDL